MILYPFYWQYVREPILTNDKPKIVYIMGGILILLADFVGLVRLKPNYKMI